MLILLATFIADAAFTALMLGVTVFALVHASKLVVPRIAIFLMIYAALATLDIAFLPAVHAMDATIIVGNEAVAGLLDLEGPTPLGELVGFQTWDAGVWFLQAVVAYPIGRRLILRTSGDT